MKMKISKLGNTVWFTNLKKPTNKNKLILEKKYNPSEYPKYDNYDAINVNKVKDIPKDYNGYMGVPLTYLGQHCPDQFEIIGITENADYLKSIYIDGFEKYDRGYINKKRMYSRIIIKQK